MNILSRIRNAFREEYVGAILNALVLMQVVSGSIGIVMMPVWFWVSSRNPVQQSIFDNSGPRVFAWNELLGSVIQLALYALVAYVLLRWLYLEAARPIAPEGEAEGDHA